METQKRPELFTKLWNSSFIRIFLAAVLCQFTMSISNTVLPLYVMDTGVNGLGLSAADSGLLGTFFTIGSMVCRFFAGYITDRFGRRVTIIMGCTITAVAMVMLGVQSALVMLLVFKVIQGIGHALSSTSANAVASEVLPTSMKGQGLGYYSLNTTFTNAIGPTISLALMGIGASAVGAEDNYLLPMLVAAGLAVAAMLLGGSLNYEKKMKELDPNAFHKPNGIHFKDFIEPRALLAAVMIFFTSFSSGASVYMIVYAKTNFSNSAISIYYIINALVGLGLRFALGARLDSIKPRTTVIVGIILNTISYLGLALVGNVFTLMLSAVLMGAFHSLLTPTFNAMAMKMAPKSRAGAASATYWLGFDIGMAVGMMVFGMVIDTNGGNNYTLAFLAAAIYMVVFGIISWFVLRGVKPMREIESPEG